ncbi:kinesin-domain-containing protein [Durotheca rogersii]|uniref:kinesin-domain-containing protein n=1 Tax=Durotheca rogersii TaxID=419775 RepID=UPI00221F6F39|nr:kinesin-domain-containing protein [Durotheca rogersii]KAI5865387.1 kinesin-domain-containing protein [Durotheca rogersii]
METENSQHKISHLRQPSARIPLPSSVPSGLNEMSNSQSNMRAQPTSGIPSTNNLLKRSVPNPALQSDAKRVVTTDRGGDFGRSAASSQYASRNVKGVALKDTARFNYSTGSGLPGSRHTSSSSQSSIASSYSMSVGPGTRPSSRSRIAHARTQSTTRNGRPASSMGTMGTREEASGKNGFVVSDIDERLGQMNSQFQEMREFITSTEKNNASVKDELEMAKKRAADLEDQQRELQKERAKILGKLTDAECQVRSLTFDLQDQQRRHERFCQDLVTEHERKLRGKIDDYEREMDKVTRLQQEFEEKCGVEAEARLENLSNENKELRSSLERQKRDHEHEVRLLNSDIDRQTAQVRIVEEKLRKAEEDQRALEVHIEEHLKTIERLRKRAEDAEERLSKDKGHLGGQISLLSQKLDFSSERIQSLEEHNKTVELECEKRVKEVELAAQKEITEATGQLRERLIKEEERRHKLFEQVQELKGNIRVMCRIKPPADSDRDALIQFNPRASELDEEKIDGITIPTEREDFREPGKMIPGKPKEFNFERVFDDRCTNKDVFDEISQLVQSVMDGKKVCIFCYGQTGSGKTYTMSRREGDGDNGIIPRTQAMIFGEVERLKGLGWEYTIEGGYLEVYQDRLYDLLASRNSKPEALTVEAVGEELSIRGHSFTLLQEERDLEAMIGAADANRHVAATAMNDRSSRSHSILVLKVRGVQRGPAGEALKTRRGTLNLIDLAGSETPDRARGDQVYQEGVQINMSLSYLRTVLSSLGQGRTEGVDFRSYTLTQLLRPSLGKGCRTLMFVMVSPLKDNESETIRSLEFARDAQKVKMGGGSNGGAAKSKK